MELLDLHWHREPQGRHYVRFSVYTCEGILIRGFRWFKDWEPFGRIVPPSFKGRRGRPVGIVKLCDTSKFELLRELRDAEAKGRIAPVDDQTDSSAD